MKVTETTRTIVETTYECEGCGHTWEYWFHTEVCPAHGEFCTNCRGHNGEMVFPFVICPKCDVDIAILYEDLYRFNDPCLFSCDDNNLRDPWVVLHDNEKDRRDGDWIGHK